MRLALKFIILCLLAIRGQYSCAELPQAQIAQSDAEIKIAKQCYDELNQDLKLSRLAPKVGLIQPGRDYYPSIEMLANKSKATKEDKSAISYWGKMRRECDEKYFTATKDRFSAEASILMRERREQIYPLLAKLYNGDVSFGEFNALRQEANSTTIKLLQEILLREKEKREQLIKENDAKKEEFRREQAESIRKEETATQQKAQLEQQQIQIQRQQQLQAAQLLMQQQQIEEQRQRDAIAEWEQSVARGQAQAEKNRQLMFPKRTSCNSQLIGNQWQTVCQ